MDNQNESKIAEELPRMRVQLDGAEVTLEELKEKRANTAPGTRIVEISAGVYKTLERLQS